VIKDVTDNMYLAQAKKYGMPSAKPQQKLSNHEFISGNVAAVVYESLKSDGSIDYDPVYFIKSENIWRLFIMFTTDRDTKLNKEEKKNFDETKEKFDKFKADYYKSLNK
jgi:hypothetical protein